MIKLTGNKFIIGLALGLVLLGTPVFFTDVEILAGICSLLGFFIFLCLMRMAQDGKKFLVSVCVFFVAFAVRFSSILGHNILNIGAMVLLSSLYCALFSGCMMLDRLFLEKGLNMLHMLMFPLGCTLINILMVSVNIGNHTNLMTYLMLVPGLGANLSWLGEQGMTFAMCFLISVFSDWLVCENKKFRRVNLGLCLVITVALFVSGFCIQANETAPDYSIDVALAVRENTGFLSDEDVAEYSRDEQLALLERSIGEAAEKGADLWVSCEEYSSIANEYLDGYLEDVSEVVRAYSMPSVLGMEVYRAEGELSINEVFFFDENGNIVVTYVKNNLVPVVEAGNCVDGAEKAGRITYTFDGHEVNISLVICFDINDSFYIRQAAGDAELLIAPSWTWDGCNTEQVRMRLRSVENKTTLLVNSYDGFSYASGPYGLVGDYVDFRDRYEAVEMIEVPIWENGAANFPAGGNTDEEVSNYEDEDMTYQLTGFSYAVIATEIFSALICLLLIYGNRYETPNRTRRGRMFSFLCITDIIALVIDAASYFLDGVPGLEVVKLICNILCVLFIYVLFFEFILYLRMYIDEQGKSHPSLFKFFYVVAGIVILASIVFSFTGELFYIENDVIEYGNLYYVYIVLGVVLALLGAVILGMSAKTLGRHDTIACYLYMLFPAVSAIISLFVEAWEFAYPASTLSLLVLYVMIQSEQTSRLESEKAIIEFHATHDELTGLLSRRSYIDRLTELEKSDGHVGVIFGDVNGLKYENDHYGHSAGDLLIIRTADAFAKHFKRTEVYRISGDEFVVLTRPVNKDVFDQRLKELERTLCAGEIQLACVGAEYGSCRKVNELVQMAETNMYGCKNEFYKIHPEMKR